MSLRAFEGWALDTAYPLGWFPGIWYSPTVSFSGGRFSDGCLDFLAGYASPKEIRRTFDAQRTWYIGFPILLDSVATAKFVGLWSGYSSSPAQQIYLQLSNTGYIQAFRGGDSYGNGTLLGTGTHALAPGTWYFVELGAYIDNDAGTLQVYVNGALDIDLSGADTQALGANSADTVVLGGLILPNGVTLRIGTVYICDDQGTSENTFLGDCRVVTQVPTGDGTYSDWTPSSGGTQYELVDDIPPDGNTTYVSSNTLNGMDTFTFDDLGVSGSVIAVKVYIDAEKDEVGVRTIAPVIRQLGTDYTYADIYPSAASYGKFTEMFLVRPSDSNPWQVSDLGSGGAEFGVVVTG